MSEETSSEYVGVRRVPIVDRSGDEPREVGWAHVTEDGTVVDSDITDPEMINKLRGDLKHFSILPAKPRQSDILYDSANRVETINEIPDTFKG